MHVCVSVLGVCTTRTELCSESAGAIYVCVCVRCECVRAACVLRSEARADADAGRGGPAGKSRKAATFRKTYRPSGQFSKRQKIIIIFDQSSYLLFCVDPNYLISIKILNGIFEKYQKTQRRQNTEIFKTDNFQFCSVVFLLLK